MSRDAGGVFHRAGTASRRPGSVPENKSRGSFFSFSDPDGSTWSLQGITTRIPGRQEVSGVLPTHESAVVLAEALRRAAVAHGRHEKRIDRADEN